MLPPYIVPSHRRGARDSDAPAVAHARFVPASSVVPADLSRPIRTRPWSARSDPQRIGATSARRRAVAMSCAIMTQRLPTSASSMRTCGAPSVTARGTDPPCRTRRPSGSSGIATDVIDAVEGLEQISREDDVFHQLGHLPSRIMRPYAAVNEKFSSTVWPPNAPQACTPSFTSRIRSRSCRPWGGGDVGVRHAHDRLVTERDRPPVAGGPLAIAAAVSPRVQPADQDPFLDELGVPVGVPRRRTAGCRATRGPRRCPPR